MQSTTKRHLSPHARPILKKHATGHTEQCPICSGPLTRWGQCTNCAITVSVSGEYVSWKNVVRDTVRQALLSDFTSRGIHA